MVNNDSYSSCVKQRESDVGKNLFPANENLLRDFGIKVYVCMCSVYVHVWKSFPGFEGKKWKWTQPVNEKRNKSTNKKSEEFFGHEKEIPDTPRRRRKKAFRPFCKWNSKVCFFGSLIWFIAKLNWTSICFTNFCYCLNISPKSILVYGTTPCRCQL